MFESLFEPFFIFFCYIFLLVFLFYLSYSNYSSYIKTPFYFVFIFLFTYLTYVTIYYWPGKNEKKGQTQGQNQLFELFTRFFFIYGEYILIIAGVFILFLVLYQILIGILIFSIQKSFWLSLGLIILVLALIKNWIYQSEPDNKYVKLILFF